MKEALKEAKKAFDKGEVPVGAVLVKEGKIISRAHNLIEQKKDASAHAELLCIRKGSAKLGNWRLCNVSLYTTLEPCSMCAGSMLLARIKTLVWGAPDIRHGAGGSWIDIFSKPHPMHQIEIKKGLLAEECGALLKEFFRMKRIKL